MRSLWSDGLLEYISDLWNIVDFIQNVFYVIWIMMRVTAWIIVQVRLSQLYGLRGHSGNLIPKLWQCSEIFHSINIESNNVELVVTYKSTFWIPNKYFSSNFSSLINWYSYKSERYVFFRWSHFGPHIHQLSNGKLIKKIFCARRFHVVNIRI